MVTHKTLCAVTTLSSSSTAAGVTGLSVAHHREATSSRLSLDSDLWGSFWAKQFSSAYTSADGKKKKKFFLQYERAGYT